MPDATRITRALLLTTLVLAPAPVGAWRLEIDEVAAPGGEVAGAPPGAHYLARRQASLAFVHGLDPLSNAQPGDSTYYKQFDALADAFEASGWARERMTAWGYYACDSGAGPTPLEPYSGFPRAVRIDGYHKPGAPHNLADGEHEGLCSPAASGVIKPFRGHDFDTDIAHLSYHWAWAMATEQEVGECAVVIAHSMGGLIVRHALSRLGWDPSYPWDICVDSVVTLGTPHEGTRAATVCAAAYDQCAQMQIVDSEEGPVPSAFIQDLMSTAVRPDADWWGLIGSDADTLVDSRSATSPIGMDPDVAVVYAAPAGICHGGVACDRPYLDADAPTYDALASFTFRHGHQVDQQAHAPWPVRLVDLLTSHRDFGCGSFDEAQLLEHWDVGPAREIWFELPDDVAARRECGFELDQRLQAETMIVEAHSAEGHALGVSLAGGAQGCTGAGIWAWCRVEQAELGGWQARITSTAEAIGSPAAFRMYAIDEDDCGLDSDLPNSPVEARLIDRTVASCGVYHPEGWGGSLDADDWIAFDAWDGERIVVRETATFLDVETCLARPSGEILQCANAAGRGREESIEATLPEAGRWRVGSRAVAGGGWAQIQVQFHQQDCGQPGDASSGGPAARRIVPPVTECPGLLGIPPGDPSDWYSFQAWNGQTISLTSTSADGRDVELCLFPPGEFVAPIECNLTEDAVKTLTRPVATSGIWALRIAQAGSPASYRLSLATAGNPIPVLSAEGSAGYFDDGVHPDQGTTATSFTYKVNYTDPLGGDPAFVNVEFSDGRVLPMALVAGAPSTGATYVATAGFGPGTFGYAFVASDGHAAARWPDSGAFSGPVVTNTPPTLGLVPSTGADAVLPSDGNPSTEFVFRVRYTDPDGGPAPTVLLRVGDTTYPMQHESGDITTGAVYHHTRRFAGGFHAHSIEATDGWATAFLPLAGAYPAPEVDAAGRLNNTGFEDGAFGWLPFGGSSTVCTEAVSSDWATRGAFSYRVKDPSASAACGVQQTVPIQAGRTYQLYATTNVLSGQPDLYLTWRNAGGSSILTRTVTAPGPGVQPLVLTDTAPAGAASATALFYTSMGRIVEAYVDELSLREIDPANNRPPTFAWTGEPGYTADAHEPPVGDERTTFRFRIAYSDPDGQPPAYVRVHFSNGTSAAMAFVGGSPLSGMVYAYDAWMPFGPIVYHFEAGDGSATTRWPASGEITGPVVTASPKLSFTGQAGYAADGVEPGQAPPGSWFTFRVRYTHAACERPTRVWLELPSASHNMTELAGGNPCGGGIDFEQAVQLFSPITGYRFRVDYGGSSHTFPETGWFTPPLVAHAPTLTYTGEPGYTTSGVSPPTGGPTSPFTYRATYKHSGGVAPAYVRLVIDGGAPRTMSFVSGTPSTGMIYSLTTTLANGPHAYRFETSDGTTVVRMPASGEISGPSVEGPPQLVPTGEAGYANDGLEPEAGNTSTSFTFRIRWNSSACRAPTYVRVYVEGAARDMEQVSGDSCSAIYSHTRTLAAGTHEHWFVASDGGQSARWPASGTIRKPVVEGPNLLLNPGFEEATGNWWSYSQNAPGCSEHVWTGWKASGTYSLRVRDHNAQVACGMYQPVSVVTRGVYQAKATVRVDLGQADLYLQWFSASGGILGSKLVSSAGLGVQTLSMTETAPDGAASVHFLLYSHQMAVSEFFADDTLLKQVG